MSEINNNQIPVIEVPVIEVPTIEIPFDEAVDEAVDEVVKKIRKQRPSITGIKYDKEDLNSYFSDYYRLKLTVDIKCECGDTIKAGCMTKHKKRAIHLNKMKKVNEA